MTAGTAIYAATPAHQERGLSPRRVRFWIAHWQELETLADGGPGIRNLREYLAREWVLLQDRPGICLCGPTDQQTARPATFAGSGFGPASLHFPELRAQLVQAGDALPLPWRATRAVFDAQGRSDVWAARLATRRLHDALRPVDREIEPQGSPIVVTERMARSTGWAPRREVA